MHTIKDSITGGWNSGRASELVLEGRVEQLLQNPRLRWYSNAETSGGNIGVRQLADDLIHEVINLKQQLIG